VIVARNHIIVLQTRQLNQAGPVNEYGAGCVSDPKYTPNPVNDSYSGSNESLSRNDSGEASVGSGDASSPDSERDASVAFLPVPVWFGFRSDGDEGVAATFKRRGVASA
jgi:hypothetical protein